jgi:signal transduction histidine kinase
VRSGIPQLHATLSGDIPGPMPSGVRGALVRRSGHRSLRFSGRKGPFLAINCAAVPETLLESELFGHARGAFTDAHAARKGLFLEAHGGTLFLDEIGEMAPGMQAKILACRMASATFAENGFDVPFALLYLVEASGKRARLAAACGFSVENGDANPNFVDLKAPPAQEAWQLAQIVETRAIELLDLTSRLGILPSGKWSESPRRAIALPLASPGEALPYGVLIAGCSPHRALDEGYRTFFELAAAQVVTAIRNANAHEEQRLRAEKLAEVDRAKTVFFSNISHEFRTPLTLMLGPLEDALGGIERSLSGESLDVTYRNARRLLKLVNTLLDFSRIEAGRVEASYQSVDLSAFTIELAGVFRSAIESAGLKLILNCEPFEESIYVDREMWEKIVLNLISNAFKFTFEGEIEVAVRRAGTHVELSVRDTGIGISANDLPRLFERFHRVEGAKARTHEGSGIGLALVQELVRLHHGEIRAESVEGEGTVFTVRIPRGTAHLPRDRVVAARPHAPTATRAGVFVEEALHWLPDATDSTHGIDLLPQREEASTGARILVVDDNADLREYLRRILETRWLVETVADGQTALAAARRAPPDLVLSDVMMPGLTGFELLGELKRDPATRAIPVILLSARAGEEARVEGLDAGADDYLIKPFGARELVARVASQLALRASNRERAALLASEQAARKEAELANHAKDQFLAMLSHELRNPLAPMITALQLMKLRGEQSRERDILERQAAHLTNLVDDLLDVSRITRGRIELRKRPIEVAETLAKAIEIASPLLEQRRHHVDIRVPAHGLSVNVDPDRMAQVISNLLTNAAKYSEAGSKISVRAERSNQRVQIRVEDNGVGIAPEMIGSVFDLFVQQPQTLARSQGGLGLGLTIVRNLVELHDGTVSVESEGVGKQHIRRRTAGRRSSGSSRGGAASTRSPGTTRRRTAHAHPSRRRQRGCRGNAEGCTRGTRLPGGGSARWTVRSENGRGLRTRDCTAGHRASGHGWLRAGETAAPSARHLA